MTDNGKVATEVTKQAIEQPERLRIDPELLTPRDMLRAKVLLDGRNPYEVANDPAEAVPLTIWCLMSRTNPEFTWDQALDFPFSRLDMASDEPPPPIGPGGSPGPEPEASKANASKPKPPAGADAPS